MAFFLGKRVKRVIVLAGLILNSRQFPDQLAMGFVAGIFAAAEPAIGFDLEMVSGSVLAHFAAGGAGGFDDAVGILLKVVEP